MSRGQWTRNLPIEERHMRVPASLTIGVLGDTHASPGRSRITLDRVSDLFRRAGAELILHTGDAGSADVLRSLEAVAPVAAVRGNADPRELIEALPDRVWIEAGDRRILLLHGHRGKTARAAAIAAAEPEIDLIVFGHSHQPLIAHEGSTILFNPGSPTERRWNPHFGVGLIRVSDETIDPELILFDDSAALETLVP